MLRPALAVLILLAARPLAAAEPAVSPTGAAVEASPRGGDPAIRRSVIEDDQVRVEELRVRGQTERIVVQPKSGARSYEILTSTHGRDPGGAADGRRGATGQRVWTVLGF